MHAVSKRIYDLLKATPGATAAKLADYAGISRAAISKWFNDPKEPIPDYKNVEKAAEYFGVSADYLWNGVDSSNDIEGSTSSYQQDNLNPDIRRIHRAHERMPEAEQQRMMRMLVATFEEYFDSDAE